MKVSALLNEIELDDKVEFSDDVKQGASASEDYQEKAKHCAGLFAEIQQAFAEHQQRAAKDPDNWGYSGNLDDVLPNLEDILHFLKS